MSKQKISGPLTREIKKGQIICVAGEKEYDLYVIHSGTLLVFVTDGTKVTPLAYLRQGEYLGELSFFDREPRSAHVMCVEAGTLVQIPVSEIDKQFPPWLATMALSITRRIRESSEKIRQKGIKKKNVDSIKPLSIEDQRNIFKNLNKYLDENPMIKENLAK